MMKQCAYCGEWHTSLEGCAIVPNNGLASQPLGDWRDAEIERLHKRLELAVDVTTDYERKLSKCERELDEARNRQSCDNGQPWICHALATARSELAEARGLLREARPSAYYMSSAYPDEMRLVARIDAALAADQPEAVKPCADCGEPTDVWHDGTHLCWKCRA